MASYSEVLGNCKVPHNEIQENGIRLFGFANLVRCVPFTKGIIKEALENGDEHLNTLPIRAWDFAAGFMFNTITGEIIMQPRTLLTQMYRQKGITAWSCAEGVCLLKYVAREWANGREN